MLVYFSASSRDMENSIAIYRRIIKVISSQGHNIANDWVEAAFNNHSKNSGWDIEEIVHNSALSIQNSEIMIAEASEISTFGVGYEVGLALHLKKPVLLLVREGTEAMSYAGGLKDELLTCEKYDEENLEKIVEAFLQDNTIQKKDLRFNFVIDRQIHNHLRLKSFKTGKTKAEVVRDLLQSDMERDGS